MNYDKLLKEIRSCCSDSDWSEAVALSRHATFFLEYEKLTEDGHVEQSILVSTATKVAATRVVIWPELQDWSCAGTSERESLVISAATVIVSKHGKLSTPNSCNQGILQYNLIPFPLNGDIANPGIGNTKLGLRICEKQSLISASRQLIGGVFSLFSDKSWRLFWAIHSIKLTFHTL